MSDSKENSTQESASINTLKPLELRKVRKGKFFVFCYAFVAVMILLQILIIFFLI